MNDTASTLASQAYTQLRTELLAGAIEPGSKIRIRQICAHIGVGLSPMREALNRLVNEGLVIQSDRRGFSPGSAGRRPSRKSRNDWPAASMYLPSR